MQTIPELEPHCGSWIVIRKSDGAAVCELFSRQLVERVNRDKFAILTTAQYLGAFNRSIRA